MPSRPVGVSLVLTSTPGQPAGFAPKWGSLDQRPCPAWYLDAKFGIFIHWGLYSVPAWAPPKEYAEWYWQKISEDKTPNIWREFHKRNFGSTFSYEDFAGSFRAELFDADQWADIFARSGAKYVVPTSKHHDGFCLWPSAEANHSWDRSWNAADIGPRRDLLGDLAQAVRAHGVKFGLYYSLYEWFNPLWLTDRAAYVSQHMFPQFKDVVTRYDPALVFTDGEWDMESADWRSEELLAWLFNDAPCAGEVVINDRWGRETRHRHGGYYTTEYGAGLKDASHAWEENRGMGYSFGYNRAESLDQYLSARELVLTLCDLVSRGGNFLLNVGPTADGRIPVIMQQRLAEIGDWLRVNGEAIYGTRMALRPCQWSKGLRKEQDHGTYKVKYNLMDEVGEDARGDAAVKQLFFTRKGRTLYAITTGWLGQKVTIRDINISTNTEITLLGTDFRLNRSFKENVLTIDVPRIAPEKMPCRDAFVFRITDAGLKPT